VSHLNDPPPPPCHNGLRRQREREERSTDGSVKLDGWMDRRPAAAAVQLVVVQSLTDTAVGWRSSFVPWT